MVLMNGPKAVTRVSSIINRGFESNGSLGGVKKAGFWTGSPYMAINNIGQSYTNRIQQTAPPLKQFLLLTTKNPLQYRRGSYSLTHAGTMMG
jgi:hypothetical protein